jgi:hypothetical protein
MNVDGPIVSVSTASNTDVSFTVRVDFQNEFFIEPSVPYNFTISPSEPRYYFYNFSTNVTEVENSNYDTVILEVFSADSVCMTVSIQNASVSNCATTFSCVYCLICSVQFLIQIKTLLLGDSMKLSIHKEESRYL